jgi:hypothetical protein
VSGVAAAGEHSADQLVSGAEGVWLRAAALSLMKRCVFAVLRIPPVYHLNKITVLWIRNRTFLGLLDPDPMDLDPDPSIIKQNSKTNLDSDWFVTSL